MSFRPICLTYIKENTFSFIFFILFLDRVEKTLYLCNVFFIVLDLRLTKVRVAAATLFFALI